MRSVLEELVEAEASRSGPGTRKWPGTITSPAPQAGATVGVLGRVSLLPVRGSAGYCCISGPMGPPPEVSSGCLPRQKPASTSCWLLPMRIAVLLMRFCESCSHVAVSGGDSSPVSGPLPTQPDGLRLRGLHARVLAEALVVLLQRRIFALALGRSAHQVGSLTASAMLALVKLASLEVGVAGRSCVAPVRGSAGRATSWRGA